MYAYKLDCIFNTDNTIREKTVKKILDGMTVSVENDSQNMM